MTSPWRHPVRHVLHYNDPAAREHRRQRRLRKALRWGYLAGGAGRTRGDAEQRANLSDAGGGGPS